MCKTQVQIARKNDLALAKFDPNEAFGNVTLKQQPITKSAKKNRKITRALLYPYHRNLLVAKKFAKYVTNTPS